MDDRSLTASGEDAQTKLQAGLAATALRCRRRVRGKRQQGAGEVEAGPEARGTLWRHLGADGP
eukprot:6151878-Alexandrium_andersonii.AAC.1